MPKTVRRENEDLESLLRRFRRSVNDANILGECRKREYFISNGEKKREKKARRLMEMRRIQRLQRHLDEKTFVRQYDYIPKNSNVGKNFNKNAENRFNKVREGSVKPEVKNTTPVQQTTAQPTQQKNSKPAYYSYRRQQPKAPKTEE